MDNEPIFDDAIDVSPRKRRVWLYVLLILAALIFLFGSRLLGIYIDALWFSSLGYSDVYWYKFKLGALLFAVFLVVTFLLVRLPFLLLNRLIPQLTERPRLRLSSVEDLREVNFLPLVYRPGVWILSIGLALMFATSMSQAWPQFALYMNSAAAGVSDPIFNRDVGFYLFKLPALNLISGWLSSISFILLLVIAGSAGYVWYVEKTQGFGTVGTQRRAVAAISAAGALFALALAFSTYLSRFDMLESRHELFSGVSYTDAAVRLPAMNILMVVLVAASLALLVNAFALKRVRILTLSGLAVAGVWLVGLIVIPQMVQSFSVKPNELAKETPYIRHNIGMTRRAYGIDRFEGRAFKPGPTLTVENIQENQETIDNIRLWDPQVLQATFKQYQEIGNYYEFREPDVDRYVMNGRLRQVMLAAREINLDKLQGQTKNWINEHLVYTHGYGVTMSTVNEFTREGAPNFVVKDMPVQSTVPEIQISRPEIYFGELTGGHVYVRTKQPEFNFPAAGSVETYTEYEGEAGIPVGGSLRKMALAAYLGDNTRLLLSDYITADSRVLLRRNVLERARHIAPFLMYEQDPYIVVSRDGRLYWMIDAFTYSDSFPYSATYPVANTPLNYIRNSVKVVVDAYEGRISFYIFDPEDPIIRSYQNIFPSLFRPSDEMPEDLRAHIRYPDLLTEVQARAFALYHIEDPQTFYNREDLWTIATIETTTRQGTESTPMNPYYLLMRLPDEPGLEFVSIIPFTPAGAGRNNMIGWMAARSNDENYGKALVFTFPKNITVNGPAQIKARVNQDPQLSQLISLWDQLGSRVLRGSLQVIPIADSLLYIEPIYLAAENSRLPELRQVAIATQDRLATAETFEEALRKLFAEISGSQAPLASGGQPSAQAGQQPPAAGQAAQPAAPPAQGQPPPDGDFDRMARQAQQLLSDYKRLTAEGRHGEAGQKLDQLNQIFADYTRRRGR